MNSTCPLVVRKLAPEVLDSYTPALWPAEVSRRCVWVCVLQRLARIAVRLIGVALVMTFRDMSLGCYVPLDAGFKNESDGI